GMHRDREVAAGQVDELDALGRRLVGRDREECHHLALVIGEELVTVRRSRGGPDIAGHRTQSPERELAPRPDLVAQYLPTDAVRTERRDEPVLHVEHRLTR